MLRKRALKLIEQLEGEVAELKWELRRWMRGEATPPSSLLQILYGLFCFTFMFMQTPRHVPNFSSQLQAKTLHQIGLLGSR